MLGFKQGSTIEASATRSDRFPSFCSRRVYCDYGRSYRDRSLVALVFCCFACFFSALLSWIFSSSDNTPNPLLTTLYLAAENMKHCYGCRSCHGSVVVQAENNQGLTSTV
jgi:hypothetical protein